MAQMAANLSDDKLIEIHPPNEEKPNWDDISISDSNHKKLKELCQQFNNGEMIAFRVYLKVSEKGKAPQQTWFDIFIRKDGYERGRPVFIRNGILIPKANTQKTTGVRSLVVIKDRPIATLLGDAENPAHTEWQEGSSNFKNKYNYGRSCLSFVKNSVHSLVHALLTQDEKPNESLLQDVFYVKSNQEESIDKTAETVQLGGRNSPPRPEIPDSNEMNYSISKIDGGFSIVSVNDSVNIPAILEVSMAYNVRRGSPLSKYKTTDFQINEGGVSIENVDGLVIQQAESNRIRAKIENKKFKFVVKGFDKERDLFVDVKIREEQND
jgi:hypothetical protein